METLLPSEIARLVLGYLEDTQCLEVAKLFLDTSTYLQECRAVALSGKKFSTKVHGFTLTHILDKFWTVNSIIQDRLNKLDEYEQLKNCKDLAEQLKLLIDGSPRGQRFVVNINVPSQTSSQLANGSSPVMTNSAKKRRHSGSLEKCNKQTLNSSTNDDEFSVASTDNSLTKDKSTGTYDMIPKEAPKFKSNSYRLDPLTTQHKSPVQCSIPSTEMDQRRQMFASNLADDVIYVAGNKSPKMYSTATDTLDIMQVAYATAEVQTAPDDVESEAESLDTPVENLSLLTKELLNRTELQEKIAENINRVLPADSLIKDTSITDSLPGELNTSIMTELNNAIKSIVTASVADPVFENFLHEVIGTSNDNQPSPDDVHQQPFAISDGMDNNPLPQNLVSSSGLISEQLSERVIIPSANTDHTQAQLQLENGPPDAKTQATLVGSSKEMPLDDYNAAAIQSIINANSLPSEDKEMANQGVELAQNLPAQKQVFISDKLVSCVQKTQETSASNEVTKKNHKKGNHRLKIPVSEPEIAVPTLIVCSKEEIIKYLEPYPIVRNTMKSQYVPIAPKVAANEQKVPDKLYLRAVNVPQRKVIDEVKLVAPPATTRNVVTEIATNTQTEFSVVVPASDVGIRGQADSITLYEAECSRSTIIKSVDMPTVAIEGTPSISGTGLSPYLKLNNHARDYFDGDTNILLNTSGNGNKNTATTTIISAKKADDHDNTLIKRTPRSLLKSRMKNYRLSLSTPRRQNSHIRALDFSTPTENTSYSKYNQELHNELTFSSGSVRPLCRTSLFKSPSLEDLRKPSKPSDSLLTTPFKDEALSMPIATRSPMPALKGEWDKISGVGSIIKHTSPTADSNDAPPRKKLATEESIRISAVVKESWDADLRRLLNVSSEVQKTTKGGGNKNEHKNRTTAGNDASVFESKDSKTDDHQNSKKIKGDRALKSHETEGAEKQISKSKKVNAPSADKNQTKEPNKKYAKVKTISTKLSSRDPTEKGVGFFSIDTATNSKSIDEIESYKRYLSTTEDLETPRKTTVVPFGIPPTPRVLSPNSNITSITSFLTGVCEDSAKVQSFITTPEFPPTPNINLTPPTKSLDATGTKKNFSAPYYQPSSETELRNTDAGKDDAKLESSVAKGAKDFVGKQLEITQFEVIKDNLPKDGVTKKPQYVEDKDKISKDMADDSKDMSSGNSSDLDNSSSSSCCSCSSSSVSCTSCSKSNLISELSSSQHLNEHSKAISDVPLNDVEFKVLDTNSLNAEKKIFSENRKCKEDSNIPENNIGMKSCQNLLLLPIANLENDLNDINTATPEKCDSQLIEANISVTPIYPKNGIDVLTNLTTKISGFIAEKPLNNGIDIENAEILMLDDHDFRKSRQNKLRTPKVDQMRQELNAKRLRMIEKLNNSAIVPTTLQKRNLKYKNRKGVKSTSALPGIKVDEAFTENVDEKILKDNEARLKIVEQSVAENLLKLGDQKQLELQEVKGADNFNKNVGLKMADVDNKKFGGPTLNSPKRKDEEKEPIKDSLKSKVDMVKRDLFSDEENNEAKANQEIFKQQKNPIKDVNPPKIAGGFLDSPKEKLVVLESLKLVPANKCSTPVELEPESEAADESINNHLEISIVHDDNTNKRRRRKLNPQNFDMKIQIGNENNSWVHITASTLTEIFSMIPAKSRSRKACADNKAIAEAKDVKSKNAKFMTPSIISAHPLAASSPILAQSEPKIAQNTAYSKKNSQDNKGGSQSGKSKEVELKTEVVNDKTSFDPKILLKQVDINEFLTKVHGPET